MPSPAREIPSSSRPSGLHRSTVDFDIDAGADHGSSASPWWVWGPVAIVFTLAAAVISCLLLSVNAAIVAAVLAAASVSGPTWLNDERTVQFCLFVGPFFVLVLQWTLIDVARRILRQR